MLSIGVFFFPHSLPPFLIVLLRALGKNDEEIAIDICGRRRRRRRNGGGDTTTTTGRQIDCVYMEPVVVYRDELVEEQEQQSLYQFAPSDQSRLSAFISIYVQWSEKRPGPDELKGEVK